MSDVCGNSQSAPGSKPTAPDVFNGDGPRLLAGGVRARAAGSPKLPGPRSWACGSALPSPRCSCSLASLPHRTPLTPLVVCKSLRACSHGPRHWSAGRQRPEFKNDGGALEEIKFIDVFRWLRLGSMLVPMGGIQASRGQRRSCYGEAMRTSRLGAAW